LLRALQVELDADGKEMKEEPFLFFTCDLAGHRFAHLKPGDGREAKDYVILRFRLDGKRLTLWSAERDAALADLKKLRIPHADHATGAHKFIEMQATTAQLRKSLTKELAEKWWPGKGATYAKVVKAK